MTDHHAQVTALRHRLQQTVIGQQALLDRLVVALLCGGHLLLEGLPGLAKTTAVKALADAVNARFQRVQFTPDLLPGDLTGGEIFMPTEGRLRFVPGPLFHDIVLADEVNRAPAKVQSALLEAMQEHQISIGGVTHMLPEMFMVLATQNPLEQAGTYPLPEAQLDRFLLHVKLDYPAAADELRILDLDLDPRIDVGTTTSAIDVAVVMQARRSVRAVHLAPALRQFIVDLVRATRDAATHVPTLAGMVVAGASPRAMLALAHAAQGLAYLRGRDFVLPDDVLELAADVLRHRLVLGVEAELNGVDADAVVAALLQALPLP